MGGGGVGGWVAGLRQEYSTLQTSSRMGLSSGPSVAKWNHHANGVESVAACAQSKEQGLFWQAIKKGFITYLTQF